MKNGLKSSPKLLVDGQSGADRTIVLAHGAGAAMDSDFMNVFVEGLVDRGLKVVRFEFPYMVQRRKTGNRHAPRQPLLGSG
jgi:uncharacterized protein